MKGLPKPRSDVRYQENAGSPTGREPYGDRVPIVVRGRESRPHGEGEKVTGPPDNEVRVMREAETVLNVIRDRTRYQLLESRMR